MSEDAVTVFANPFLIDDPAPRWPARLAPLLGEPESELLEKLGDRKSGFIYLKRKLDPSRGEKVRQLKIEGIGTVDRAEAQLPAGRARHAADRHGGHRQLRASRGSSSRARSACTARTASAGS